MFIHVRESVLSFHTRKDKPSFFWMSIKEMDLEKGKYKTYDAKSLQNCYKMLFLDNFLSVKPKKLKKSPLITPTFIFHVYLCH